MTYKVGDVVVVNTADISGSRGDSGNHMILVKDEQLPMDKWWAFFIDHITPEDLERLRRKEKVGVKIRSVEDGLTVVVEAPQSPPDLRYHAGRCYCMGFESQEWGRYPWLE